MGNPTNRARAVRCIRLPNHRFHTAVLFFIFFFKLNTILEFLPLDYCRNILGDLKLLCVFHNGKQNLSWERLMENEIIGGGR